MNFKHQSTLPLTLANFISFYQIELQQIYKQGTWKRLCADAGLIDDFNEPNEKEIRRGIDRLIQGNSISYFRFIQYLIDQDLYIDHPTEEQHLLQMMFHYDVWQEAGTKFNFDSLHDSLRALRANPILISELQEVLAILIQRVNFIEKEIDLGYALPLRIHSRYNRDEILAALRMHQFDKKSSNREGIALKKDLNTEALFVTLKKSDKEYSPTTQYKDYALSEYLFHWQTQNSASPDTDSGKAYINQNLIGRRILIFVREQNKDEYGNTLSYVFLGEADFVKTNGAKPMNVEWRLQEAMPAYIWKESGKLSVG